MFDFLEAFEEQTDDEYRLLEFSPTEPFAMEFDMMGYGSIQTFDNLGTLKFMLLYFMMLALYIGCIKLMLCKVKNKLDSKLSKKLTKAHNNVRLLEGVVTFTMQSFFDLCILLFIYFKAKPGYQDKYWSIFGQVPNRFPSDKLCLVVSILLQIIVMSIYVYTVVFFVWVYPKMQNLYQSMRKVKLLATFEQIFKAAL